MASTGSNHSTRIALGRHCRSLRTVSPGYDLRYSLQSGGSGEVHQRCVASHRSGNVDWPGSRERGIGHRVGDGHGQRGIANGRCDVKPRLFQGVRMLFKRSSSANRSHHGPYVQVITSCVAVCPPVPALKPRKAIFPPTIAGILMVQEVVNVALVTVSVIVIVSVVPS